MKFLNENLLYVWEGSVQVVESDVCNGLVQVIFVMFFFCDVVYIFVNSFFFGQFYFYICFFVEDFLGGFYFLDEDFCGDFVNFCII